MTERISLGFWSAAVFAFFCSVSTAIGETRIDLEREMVRSLVGSEVSEATNGLESTVAESLGDLFVWSKPEIVTVELMTSSGAKIASLAAERKDVDVKTFGFVVVKDLTGGWHFCSGAFVFIFPRVEPATPLRRRGVQKKSRVSITSSDGRLVVYSAVVDSSSVTIGRGGYCHVESDGKSYESVGGIAYISPAQEIDPSKERPAPIDPGTVPDEWK